MENSSSSNLPKCLVFDLDGCLWYPEMFQLWGGGGAPFKLREDGDMTSRGGEKVYLMNDTREIMRELATEEKWSGTKVAVASKCDEPRWALELIENFGLGSNLKLRDALNGPKEIYKGNKADHMRTISSKLGNIPLEEMIFFDNEIGNCRDVSGAGATVVYTPQGLNRELFELGIRDFPKPGKILGPVGR